MTAKAIYKKLTEQRKDLEALRSDLPKIEGLLEQHRQAADKAKRAGAPFDEQATLRSRVDGFESVLRQHKADITTLETLVNDLQAQYDRASGEERLSVQRAEYEALTTQHRDATRELLTEVSQRLGSISEIEAAARAKKFDIEKLGLELGVYVRNEATMNVSSGIRALELSRPFQVFDEIFPQIRSDLDVLGLLEEVRCSDAVLNTGIPRQELRAKQDEAEASAERAREALQASAQEKVRERENYRRALAGQSRLTE